MRKKENIVSIPRSITIKGAYGDANIGDDLLLDMIISVLKEVLDARTKIVLVAKKAPYLRNYYPQVSIISQPASKLKYTDVYILGGGTQLFSFKSGERRSKFEIYWHFIKNEPFLLLLWLKHKFSPKRPLAGKFYALGIGLGPFEEKEVETSVKGILSNYHKVYVRDKYSKEYLIKWGFHDYFFGADLCLTSRFKEQFNFKKQGSMGQKPRIGLVLRSWSYGEYGDRLNDIVLKTFEDKRVQYHLYVFSTIKDQELIETVGNRADMMSLQSMAVWDPDRDTFHRFLEDFSKNDIIVTSRYHAAIFALNFNIPTICIGIDPKLKALCEEVAGFYYWEVSENADFILESITKIFEDYETHQSSIRQSYSLLNERSDEMINDFVKTVFGNADYQ